jgi:hypothetical protein
MTDRFSSPEARKPDDARAARLPWVRPTVTKMIAADAEIGTRNSGPDGSFSVS